jgi:CHAT domain-containing protein/tetratricopeptide (TPR) repeat protein
MAGAMSMIGQIKKCSGAKSRVREVTFCVLSLFLTLLLWSGSKATSCAGDVQAQAGRATNGEQQADKDLRLLEPGKLIEREMTEGQAHYFQIILASGQYLRVVVNQRGIDVVVTLIGPDGKKLIEADSPNGARGSEMVELITGLAGDYRLEVRSVEKDGATGRYEVKIAQLREASPEDHNRVAAQKAMAEGRQLRDQRAEESHRKAIERFEAALLLYQAARDRKGEAAALKGIGGVYRMLREKQKAVDYLNQALELQRKLGDSAEEASILNEFGVLYFSSGESQRALDYYHKAFEIQRALGLHPRVASILNNIAEIYNDLREKEKALEYLHQRLQVERELGNAGGEAATLNNIASVYNLSGEKQKALDYYARALERHRALGNRQGQGRTLNNIGHVYLTLDEHKQALDYLNQALEIRRILGDRGGQAITLMNISTTYSDMGEKQKALEIHQQMLKLWKDAGDRREEARVLLSLASLYQKLGETEKAMNCHQQALVLARAMGNQGIEADAFKAMASLERGRGNLAAARERIEEALAIIESTRFTFAGQETRAAYFAQVRDKYELYTDLLMQLHRQNATGGDDAAALQNSERARARSLLESLAEARANIRQGVDPVLLERERTLQKQLNTKAAAQARLLGGKHTEEEAAAAEQEIRTLTTQYYQLQALIRTKSPRYAGLTQPQTLNLKDIQQQVLDENTLLLEYALGNERSYLWAVLPTSITSYELPKRAEIEAAARRVYELLTARHLAPGESEQQWRTRFTKADAEYQSASATLSEMLLGPAASLLGDKRLVIVADGMLQYVPFAALPEPRAKGESGKAKETKDKTSSPLIVAHEIISLPSASVLALLRRETAGRQPVSGEVAVLADPVFDKDDDRVVAAQAKAKSEAPAANEQYAVDNIQRVMREVGMTDGGGRIPRLPSSREEAEAIVASASVGRWMKAVNFKADRATATSGELGKYRVVHFATHGLFSAERPELSGVVLSLVDEAGRPQDGFLRLHEIYNLELPVELVVLSACQTGLGKDIKGEGLVGLVRGFMYAGAPRVVASLWKVDDFATKKMMEHFYRAMLKEGMRPAEALRHAQIAIWKQKRLQAPYYWAGFVIQGEWK